MSLNTAEELNTMHKQVGVDAISRMHSLELENQKLQRDLEAVKTDNKRIEKEAAYELQLGNKKMQAHMSSFQEQVISLTKYFVMKWILVKT